MSSYIPAALLTPSSSLRISLPFLTRILIAIASMYPNHGQYDLSQIHCYVDWVVTKLINWHTEKMEIILELFCLDDFHIFQLRNFLDELNLKHSAAKQQISWVFPQGGFASRLLDQGAPKKLLTTAPSSRSECHLTVFCINQIVPGFVVYYLNT